MAGYQDVRVEIIGDPLGVERAFRERDLIQREHMAAAMTESLEHLQEEWKRAAPFGKGREANPNFPSWKPRAAGTYKESIKISPPVPFEGDNLIGEVFSDDMPVARILESGSGIYRTGPGSRSYIRARHGKYLAIPLDSGDEAVGGFTADGARFVKAVKGQRPQHIARRARILSAPYTREKFKEHAKLAAEQIKRML